jgi:hypothetical protein
VTASRSLPARPSLESLRKQARKLARERAVSLRDAQLLLAREYGFAGWQDLIAEVSKRVARGLEWAIPQAERAIHDNDVQCLKQLLADHPALLSWQGDEKARGLLGMATSAYGDAGDPQRERWFTRGACAEVLIDAGAVIAPQVCESILRSRAKGLLDLFQRKGVLPRTLEYLAAIGDLEGVRAALDRDGCDLTTVNEAFVCACHFEREAVASLLLERSIALDPELGQRIDGSVSRLSFIKAFEKADSIQVAEVGLRKVFVMEQVMRAAHGDLQEFVRGLEGEPSLLGERFVSFQAGLVLAATLNDRPDIIGALLERGPALLKVPTTPEFHPIAQALTYGKTHLIPLLTRIWPLPDDLPHAAGMGDLARAKRWFDESGAPALGELAKHYPCNDPHALKHDDLRWGSPTAQHVLDTALAWAVINRKFEVADFLLEHGANINTNWNSHEPASILHHLVFLQDSYESMQYLIDRGIDMNIKDYRWNSNAAGWARYGNNNERMARWLEEGERQQRQRAE